MANKKIKKYLYKDYDNLKQYNVEQLKSIIYTNYDNLDDNFNISSYIKKDAIDVSLLKKDILEAVDSYMSSNVIIDLRKIVGNGYDLFFESTNNYLVVKGSRGSKKSTEAAIKIVYLMLKYPLSNAIILRFLKSSHRESTFPKILEVLDIFNLYEKIDYTVNKTTLEITFIKTGQSIRFFGVRNAGTKFTSIEARQKNGFLNLMWLEEAFEVSNKYESDFDKIVNSFSRKKLPEGYFSQIIITFNPYSPNTWLKERFFNEDPNKNATDTLALTTTWRCNIENLTDTFINARLHEEKYNIRKAVVNSFGEWGVSEGLIFSDDNIEILDFEPKQLPVFRGLDYGKIKDPTAYIASYLDINNKTIYVFNEFYKTDLDTDELYNELILKYNLKNKTVFSEIEHLINKSFAKKGVKIIQTYKKPNNLLYELETLASFKIVIHPNCTNFINEIKTYALDSDGYPIDLDNHLMDAFRYSYNAVLYPDVKRYRYKNDGSRKKADVSNVYKQINRLL